MMFWKRVEIYCGYSLKEFSDLKNSLALQGIRYDYKIMNNNNENRSRGWNLGLNRKFESLYYLYVNHKDYEHAMFITSNRNN
jgi:hypothetical protein